MQKRVAQIATLVCLFGINQLTFAQARDVPVDASVKIVLPSPDIAKELRTLSGKWAGSFNGTNTGAYMSDAFLAVEEIVSPQVAKVYFGHIGRHRWNRDEKVSTRVDARIENGDLVFAVPDGRTVTCKVSNENTLTCTMPTTGIGSLKRIKE